MDEWGILLVVLLFSYAFANRLDLFGGSLPSWVNIVKSGVVQVDGNGAERKPGARNVDKQGRQGQDCPPGHKEYAEFEVRGGSGQVSKDAGSGKPGMRKGEKQARRGRDRSPGPKECAEFERRSSSKQVSKDPKDSCRDAKDVGRGPEDLDVSGRRRRGSWFEDWDRVYNRCKGVRLYFSKYSPSWLILEYLEPSEISTVQYSSPWLWDVIIRKTDGRDVTTQDEISDPKRELDEIQVSLDKLHLEARDMRGKRFVDEFLSLCHVVVLFAVYCGHVDRAMSFLDLFETAEGMQDLKDLLTPGFDKIYENLVWCLSRQGFVSKAETIMKQRFANRVGALNDKCVDYEAPFSPWFCACFCYEFLIRFNEQNLSDSHHQKQSISTISNLGQDTFLLTQQLLDYFISISSNFRDGEQYFTLPCVFSFSSLVHIQLALQEEKKQEKEQVPRQPQHQEQETAAEPDKKQLPQSTKKNRSTRTPKSERKERKPMISTPQFSGAKQRYTKAISRQSDFGSSKWRMKKKNPPTVTTNMGSSSLHHQQQPLHHHHHHHQQQQQQHKYQRQHHQGGSNFGKNRFPSASGLSPIHNWTKSSTNVSPLIGGMSMGNSNNLMSPTTSVSSVSTAASSENSNGALLQEENLYYPPVYHQSRQEMQHNNNNSNVYGMPVYNDELSETSIDLSFLN